MRGKTCGANAPARMHLPSLCLARPAKLHARAHGPNDLGKMTGQEARPRAVHAAIRGCFQAYPHITACASTGRGSPPPSGTRRYRSMAHGVGGVLEVCMLAKNLQTCNIIFCDCGSFRVCAPWAHISVHTAIDMLTSFSAGRVALPRKQNSKTLSDTLGTLSLSQLDLTSPPIILDGQTQTRWFPELPRVGT